MASTRRTMAPAALALVVLVCHAAIGVNSNHGATKAYAVQVNTNDDDFASIPDFDRDGTIGFGDFLIFAERFGTRQGDAGYDAEVDLNDDGEIEFADFLIFAENFGKEVAPPVAEAAILMYWADTNVDKIQRSYLDGSGVETLVATGLDAPIGIALDVAGDKMYWTDPGADRIQRSNLDGSGVETLVTTGLDAPIGIALDVAGGKMYWTDSGTDKIQRSNLDGSGVEDPRNQRIGVEPRKASRWTWQAARCTGPDL